jgi:hypothetical protein
MTEAQNDDPDTGGRAVPPYKGRRESADVSGGEELRKDSANVGGATGPVESGELKSTPKQDTPRGPEASPADEQPASEMPETQSRDDEVGPDHYAGTGKGENKAEGSGKA